MQFAGLVDPRCVQVGRPRRDFPDGGGHGGRGGGGGGGHTPDPPGGWGGGGLGAYSREEQLASGSLQQDPAQRPGSRMGFETSSGAYPGRLAQSVTLQKKGVPLRSMIFTGNINTQHDFH